MCDNAIRRDALLDPADLAKIIGEVYRDEPDR